MPSSSKPAISTALLVTAGVLLLATLHSAAAQSPTPKPLSLTIGGTVASGTAGVSVPAGLPISLHVARLASQGGLPMEVVKLDAPLPADNTFRFDNVAALPGDIAFITTTFEGTVQGSQLIPLTDGQTSLTIPVTLYAATTNNAVITLIRVQHILDFKSGNVLQILATYDYKNTSDRLYFSGAKTANGQPVSVSIPLPIGARAIAFSTQPTTRFVLGGDVNARVVQDTKPVLPGQVHEIIFSYQLPYSRGAAIDQDYPYNTTSVEILIPDDINVSIGDDKFVKSPNMTINPNRAYSQYALKSGLNAGDRLIYVLGGAAQVVTPSRPSPPVDSAGLPPLVIVAGLATLIAAAGFALVQFGRRGRS